MDSYTSSTTIRPYTLGSGGDRHLGRRAARSSLQPENSGIFARSRKVSEFYQLLLFFEFDNLSTVSVPVGSRVCVSQSIENKELSK